MTGLVLGAYVAAPTELADDDAVARDWYARLRDEPLVGGLELAWDRELFPDRADRLAPMLDPGWSSVVTMMAGVSARLSVDPAYGLASEREESRRLAVADVLRARQEIARLCEVLGPRAVRAVEIQSAPSASAGASAAAFGASLRQILDADWGDVAVVVEHCDGADGVSPAKAFLPLRTEVSCLDEVRRSTPGGARSGHAVNWARSVIERRSVDGADQAIRTLVADHRLAGLMFSGVAPVATDFGKAWADSHLPVADGGTGSEPQSLLTAERVRSALSLAGPDLGYLGAKISAPKIPDLGLDERLAPGLATLRVIAGSCAA